MSWVRLDDQFPIHRKVDSLSDPAFRLHVSAICWCARNLTDGCVSEADLDAAAPRTMKRPGRFVAELVRRGVWSSAADGWTIHDFLDYQPSKARVEEDRVKNAQRQRRFASRKKVRDQEKGTTPNAVSNALATPLGKKPNAVADGVTNAAPSRPVPKGDNSLRSSSPSPRGDPDFERFYAAFPKRVGRKAAEAAWMKAMKDGADAAVVIAGAKRYADEREDEDSKYTKQPATWLNHGCWEDEPQRRRREQTVSENDQRIAQFLRGSDGPGRPEQSRRQLPPGEAS